jgi:peroxiredoxin
MEGNMTGTLSGLIAAAIILVAGIRWMQLTYRVQLPADATPYVVACAAAAVLGLGALVLGTGVIGGIAGGLSLVGGLAFLALFSASGQRRRPPAVAVGEPVLDVTTTDDEGRAFTLSSLRGRPFLLKFFRGHWCPYCVAELRRWQDMRPALDALDVAMVTVCTDTAEQIRTGRGKHGLEAVMLPDPSLAITDRFGLRNPRNFAPKPGIIVPLPIPTTILVDADGVVRWIDQASDYMRRSDPARVLAEIHAILEKCTRDQIGIRSRGGSLA